MMFISREVADYHVLVATQDINLYSNISELQKMIEEALERGVRKFAVRFTPNSYLLSRSMAVLVKCIESVADRKGSFAILNPNEQIMDFLAVVDLEHKIRFYRDESELAANGEASGQI
ncbi:MAG: hypothetical protein GF344_08155 [Chitinivibrionales bacterium]|nr:hypothetical protein [Chitinivibrionales bacterium]